MIEIYQTPLSTIGVVSFTFTVNNKYLTHYLEGRSEMITVGYDDFDELVYKGNV